MRASTLKHLSRVEDQHQNKRPRLELDDEELWGPEMTAEEVDTIQSQVSTIESQFSISAIIPLGGVLPSTSSKRSFTSSVNIGNGDSGIEIDTLHCLEGRVKMLTSDIQKERKDKEEMQRKHQLEVGKLQSAMASLQGQLQFKDQEMKSTAQKIHVLEQRIRILQQKPSPPKGPREQPVSSTSSLAVMGSHFKQMNSFVTSANSVPVAQPSPTPSTFMKNIPIYERPRKTRRTCTITISHTPKPSLMVSEELIPLHHLAHHLNLGTSQHTLTLLRQIWALFQATPSTCSQDEHCPLDPLLECSTANSQSKLHQFLLQPFRITSELGKEESSILLEKYMVLHAAYLHNPARFSRLDVVELLREASLGCQATLSIALELCFHLLPKELQPCPGLNQQLCVILEKHKSLLYPVTQLLTCLATRYSMTSLLHKEGFIQLLTRYLSLLGLESGDLKSRILEADGLELGALEPGLLLMTHLTFYLPHHRLAADPALSGLLWTMATVGVQYSPGSLAYPLYSMTTYDALLQKELKKGYPTSNSPPS